MLSNVKRSHRKRKTLFFVFFEVKKNKKKLVKKLVLIAET